MSGMDKEPEKNLHPIKQEMDHEIYNGLSSNGTKRRISDECEDPTSNLKFALPVNMNKYELAAEGTVDPVACSASGSPVKKDEQVEQSPIVMVASHTSPSPQIDEELTFFQPVDRMDKLNLAEMHAEKVKALMIYDPKRKDEVPSRFCSFHLANFNLAEMSKVPLGPPYEESDACKMAASSINVISVRVVKAGPGFPVEVYGKIIARDEVDYKCVPLYDRERGDALINSEQDVLALTGPCRALVTMGLLFFEFDLKIKGKGQPDDDAQFSKGVMPYYHNPYNKRIIEQLPSFESTVKLVLQHVASPVAASVEANVVKKLPGDALVHFDGKITIGTSRNYRHHMVVYDSSLPSPRGAALVRNNGSLVLNRNLMAVRGPVYDTAFEEDEQMTLYVCFLDAGSEIEDEDYTSPEEEDYISADEEDVDDDDIGVLDRQVGQEERDEEEDHKNIVTLKYPVSKTVWENLSHKLELEVKWSAIPPARFDAEFITRLALLPKGYMSPNYRWGPFFE